MARKFSYPEVQQLEEGDSTLIAGVRHKIKRRVDGYGKRSNKHFSVEYMFGDSWINPEGDVETRQSYRVTRLPDPEPRAE